MSEKAITANSECEMCFGTGAKPNVPVYVECQECDGTGQDYSANVRHPTTSLVTTTSH